MSVTVTRYECNILVLLYTVNCRKVNIKNCYTHRVMGVSYIHINTLSGISGLLNKKLWLFKIEAFKRMKQLRALRTSIRQIYETNKSSDMAVPKVYDLEYKGEDGPNYAYINALLFKKDFEKIVGLASREIVPMKIIDIGAGSDELLRFCHSELGVPSENLFGSDISRASKEIILRDGFQGYAGRIEDLHFPENNSDIAFLTYFIDYDTDQEKTFEETVRIVRPGGKIILEGKFPVDPFGLTETDKTKLQFITKGNNAPEDIDLVCQAFLKIGQSQNKRISVEKIVQSTRYVYSHYGLCQLPSYFLVFRVEK